MNPVLVAGTWSWKGVDGPPDWYYPGQPFGRFLTEQGVAPLYEGDQPFIWSTELAGIPWFTSVKSWEASGASLAYFLIGFKSSDKTAVIAHSHGLQVVAFACANHNLKIDTLITVGSPIRHDLESVYAAMRRNVRYWLHIHSDGSDKWEWRGELFDTLNPFKWRVRRDAPLADQNDFVPHVGHSDLLRNPDDFHFWLDKGWINKLR